MFNIKWMYSFWQDEVLYEEVMEEKATKERIAELFFDHHVTFIFVNEILYGLEFNGSWSNRYCGDINNYRFNLKAVPYTGEPYDDFMPNYDDEWPYF